MVDETLKQLIDFLREASPFVWQTLIKQVYVDAVANFIWAVIFATSAYFLIRLGAYSRKKVMEETKDSWRITSDWEYGVIGGYGGGVSCALIASLLLTSVITHVANPEFYALKYILEKLAP